MLANDTEMDLDTFLETLMKSEYVAKFPFSLFYSEGSKYFRIRLYKKAIERLDEALMDEPSNMKALLTRAKVHICLQQYEKAKEDATEALVICPEHSEAFDLKGRSEFLMGDFERAYLTYLDGRKIRPDVKNLRLGQQLCEESMTNSMKISSGMNIDKDDIRLMSKTKDGGNRFEKSSRKKIPTYESFTKDKKILNELLLDPHRKNVHSLCRESLDYIHHSERFWAMQRPFHSRKKIQAPRKRITKEKTIVELMTSMQKRCREYLQNEDMNLCIGEGKKLVRLMESRSDVPTEQSINFKAEIYDILSIAYETKQDDAQCLEFLKKQLNISLKSEFIHPQIRAYHHLGRYYAKKRYYPDACHCFLGIAKALKPEKIKKYLEERHRYVVEEEIKDEDISDIKDADAWAKEFKRNLMSLGPPSVVSDLLLHLLQEDIYSLNLE